MTFGEKLKRLRQERGKSRVELAAAVGVSAGFVRDLEQGHRVNPGWNTVQLIARYLLISCEALASEPGQPRLGRPRPPAPGKPKGKRAKPAK